MNETYVLDLPSKRWTTFTGLDSVSSCVMSGGSTLSNINLLMDNQGVITKYPDDNQDKVATAYVVKELNFFYPNFKSITLKHIAENVDGTIVILVTNEVKNFTLTKTITVDSDLLKKYGLPLGSYGNKIKFTVNNIDKIENILLLYNERNARG